MIDILVYLFENYHDLSSHPENEALARKLGAVGFEKQDISTALDWLSELKNAPVQPLACHSDSIRIFLHEELSKLGPDSYRFLVFLESADLITAAQREIIIDRVMVLDDSPVPLDRFKIIVLMVLWSCEQFLEPLIVEELLSENDPLVCH